MNIEMDIYMSCFIENRPPVPEKKVIEGFYHIWALQPSWSCNLESLLTSTEDLPSELFILLSAILVW